MCTSSEMIVTTTSIITLRPSTIVPTVNFSPPISNQVFSVVTGSTVCSSAPPPPPPFSPTTSLFDVEAASVEPCPAVAAAGAGAVCCASFTRLIQLPAARSAMTKHAPTATMPISDPFFGRRLPKNRMATNDIAMMNGISHTQWRIIAASPAHRVDFVEVDRRSVPVEHEDDGEADTDLSGCDGDDEQGEDLSHDRAVQRAEGDEVDVDRVEDQLDRHQHHHAVAAGEHAVHADGEQGCAEEQELVEQHPYSFLARTMAPTRAARSRTETTSNGIRYCWNNVSLTVAVNWRLSSGSLSVPNASMSA